MHRTHIGRTLWNAIPVSEAAAVGLREISEATGIDRVVAGQYLSKWRKKGVVVGKPGEGRGRQLRQWRTCADYVSVYLSPAILIARQRKAE